LAGEPKTGPIKVIIVDDSNFMRRAISNLISRDPDIKVIATARDGYEAVELVRNLEPDVVTLDIEMEGMSGIETLERIMKVHPVPVLMVSAYTSQGAEVTVEALRLGAIDFIEKPSGVVSVDMHTVSESLVRKIKMAAKAEPKVLEPAMVRRPFRKPLATETLPPLRPPDSVPPPVTRPPAAVTMPLSVPPAAAADTAKRPVSPDLPPLKIVAIGSSTGGVQALQHVLGGLPENFDAPVVIVQHMPAKFTRSFASDLDRTVPVMVREAEDGMPVRPGVAYVAPGGIHMIVAPVQERSNQYCIRLTENPPDLLLKPAADVLFAAVAEVYGPSAVGVILTGMGSDGTLGMRKLKEAGAYTIAQNRETCVVFGMPKSAIEAGVVDEILPLQGIADTLLNHLKQRARKT